MARFYRIKFDSLYLTSDGTVAGLPCKLTVSNVDALILGITGKTEPAIDGTPITTLTGEGKGIVFEIAVESVKKAQFEAQKTLIKSAILSSSSVHVVGTGDGGDFNVDAIPQMPQPFSHGRFSGGRILNVTFRFMTI